jgi:hypothetical protein
VPYDPGFTDIEARPPRQDEQFHIESEPRDRQTRKERVRGLGAEQLEATLRVGDSREGEHPDMRIEHAANQVPEPVLTDPPRPWRLTRPDDDVRRGRYGSGVEKPDQVVGRHREVGIRHEPPFAPSCEHSGLYGLALSTPSPANETHATVGGCGLFDDGPCPITAPVVDDDQFPRQIQPVEVDSELPDGAADRLLFVEGGNND